MLLALVAVGLAGAGLLRRRAVGELDAPNAEGDALRVAVRRIEVTR
jgi:hypothetical protein